MNDDNNEYIDEQELWGKAWGYLRANAYGAAAAHFAALTAIETQRLRFIANRMSDE